jgi:pyruvate dehydrogenase E2 component (dihydrolipoamide acetyltransferase)
VSSGGKALAAPPVRRLAREMGIDLDRVTGTGKEGRITAQDLKQVSSHSEVERLEDDLEVPLVGVRGMMAKKMAEAKRLVPHFSFFEKVNVERLLKLHDNVKKEGELEGIRVTFMPYFIRALSLTINEFPELNSSLDQSTLLLHRHHNIGIAMSTEQGLTVPVLKDVQLLSFPDVIRSYEKLKHHAADKKLIPADMKGGTVTISNFGVFGNGGVWATPIINPPESAILAVNRIQKQPVVKHDKLVIGDVLDLSWSFDHRVIDGNLASAISHHFAKLIENPAFLL